MQEETDAQAKNSQFIREQVSIKLSNSVLRLNWMYM